MKVRRLAAAVAVTAALFISAPTWADGEQPIPGPPDPGPDSVIGMVRGFASAASFGIEISGALL